MRSILDTERLGLPVETPFIDVHGHWGAWHITFVPWATDAGRLIDDMDRFGCDMVWMCAADSGYTASMSWKNDVVFDLAAKHPRRILPYCTLSANETSSCLDELKRCVSRGPCVGIKLHVSGQPSYTIEADFLRPIFEFLSERGMVCMHHSLGEEEAIRRVCRKYPGMTLIAGHISQTANNLAKEFSTIRDCLCAAMSFDAVGKEVKRIGTSETILVGSDVGLFPLSFGLGMVAYADITDADKRNILGLNALKLLSKMKWFNVEDFPRLADKLRRD